MRYVYTCFCNCCWILLWKKKNLPCCLNWFAFVFRITAQFCVSFNTLARIYCTNTYILIDVFPIICMYPSFVKCVYISRFASAIQERSILWSVYLHIYMLNVHLQMHCELWLGGKNDVASKLWHFRQNLNRLFVHFYKGKGRY